MIRVVLDTNTLASGAIASKGSLEILMQVWRDGQITVILSQAILKELARTLANPYFSRLLHPADIIEYLDEVRARAITAAITTEIHGIATHPEDDLILATALDGGADYLVTGDKKLQALGSWRGIAICSPRTFVEMLAADIQ